MAKKFSSFVFVQVLILLLMAFSHYAVEHYGEEVRLKTAPVDPRDIFYGDYVILNYEISDMDISKFDGDEKPEAGDAVYILLEKEGDYHQAISAHLEKPSAASGQILLKGRVQYVNNRWDPQLGETEAIQSVHIVYGFERYYVPEGTGRDWEDQRGQFDAIVKVAPWGQNLSSLSFIANGVMTQREAHDRVYEHFSKQSLAIDILRTHLERRYKEQERAVWVMEAVIIKNKMDEKIGKPLEIVMDARTGEILD